MYLRKASKLCKPEENSFSTPFKVVPEVSELSGIGSTFNVDCPANSLMILRIPCKK